jgi:cell wall-associated NlpC family hydrolase
MTLRGVRRRPIAWVLATSSVAALLIATGPSSQASQSIAAVQEQVTALQIQASAIAESAQQSQVDLISLTRSLSAVKAQDSVQTLSLSKLKKSIGILAAEQYKNGSLGQGLTLMFSSDPTRYLNSAQSLSVVESQNVVRMRKFAAADIALKSTALTLNQKVALVAAVKAKYQAQEVAAQAKLSQAQKLLSGLTKSERRRLAALQAQQERSYQKKSLKLAQRRINATGAAATALHFALRQLGSLYMFGGAGLVYWDCSGLTSLTPPPLNSPTEGAFHLIRFAQEILSSLDNQFRTLASFSVGARWLTHLIAGPKFGSKALELGSVAKGL